jgi:hypothetical protein
MPDFVRQGEHVDEAETTQSQSAAVVDEEEPSERKSLYDQLREDKGMSNKIDINNMNN